MNKYTRFYHLRLENGGAITGVALRDIETGIIKVGLSFCSPKDIFNKAKGRKIAMGRATKCPMIEVGTNSNKAIKNVLVDITKNELCRELNGVPRWVPYTF